MRIANRRLGLCLTASAAFHGVLLAALGTLWPPLGALRPRSLPPSAPFYVTLIPVATLDAAHSVVHSRPIARTTPDAPHSSFARHPIHVDGSAHRRSKLAAVSHPAIHVATESRPPSLEPARQLKVVSRDSDDDPDIATPVEPRSQAESRPPSPPGPLPNSLVPGSGEGSPDSGARVGFDQGSDSGIQGNGNGAEAGPGQANGSGGGRLRLDSGTGEGPRHIVYVVDESGSMTSRIDTTRNELTGALSTLTPDESFNIIAFSTTPKLFDADGMELATPNNISLAENWLGYQRPDGGTDLQAALMRAIDMPGANVVVLITDGVPTIGETDFDSIARNVRNRNRNRVKIYTIGLVDKDADSAGDAFDAARLLQRLASDSGGTSKFVSLGDAAN